MSGFNFDLFVRAMEIALACFAVLGVILVALVVLVRVRRARMDQRRRWLHARWRPFFAGDGVRTVDLPALDARDAETVLLLWSAMRPQGSARMDEIARSLGLDRFARRLLESRDDGDRIIALDALGWLGDDDTVKIATVLVEDPSGRLSQAAGEALLRLRPSAIGRVLEEIRSNAGWMRRTSEEMLLEAGPAVVDPAMRKIILEAPPAGQVALLDYVRACSGKTVRDIALALIEGAPADAVLAAALRALAVEPMPQDAEIARRYLSHPQPFVQVAALRVLAKTGGAADAERLAVLACDPDWWVRRRAAQVLADLAPATATKALQDTHDEFARDALEHALAGRQS